VKLDRIVVAERARELPYLVADQVACALAVHDVDGFAQAENAVRVIDLVVRRVDGEQSRRQPAFEDFQARPVGGPLAAGLPMALVPQPAKEGLHGGLLSGASLR